MSEASIPKPQRGWGKFVAAVGHANLYHLAHLGVILGTMPSVLIVPWVFGSVSVGLGATCILSGITVLALTPPLPALAHQSALLSRLAWLGRYVVAAIVLVVGVVVAGFFEGLSREQVIATAPTVLLQIMPIGLSLLLAMLLVDLFRLPAGKRRQAVFEHVTRTDTWMSVSAVGTVAHLAAAGSHPVWLIVWTALGGISVTVMVG